MSNITVRVGDLLQSNAQTLVNTVNCVGVMGKGIAASFKERFPRMYADYVRRCGRHEVRLGMPYLHKDLVGPWVLNFPTKDHWRAVSKLSDIVAGLEFLVSHYKEWGVLSLAVPPLGCGNGQLDWNVVGPTLYRYLSQLDIPVELYAPLGTPEEQLSPDFLARDANAVRSDDVHKAGASLAPATIALVSVVSRIKREPYHWPIGRTGFQKVAYFLTESGVPTGLHYGRGSYGPFSPELKPLIGKLINHEVAIERKRGQMLEIIPGPTYLDARNLYLDKLKEWARLIERVADLFLRLPRTVDAEIAATVHFVAKEFSAVGLAATERDVLNEVMRWKIRRKPPLAEADVAQTIRNLNMLGWIDLKPSEDIPVGDDELLYA